MDDERVIKSYVWHGDKCFFVSTIERDSSAPIIPAPRYNETIVWEYFWTQKKQGKIIGQESDRKGSISTHQTICYAIFTFGRMPTHPEESEKDRDATTLTT